MIAARTILAGLALAALSGCVHQPPAAPPPPSPPVSAAAQPPAAPVQPAEPAAPAATPNSAPTPNPTAASNPTPAPPAATRPAAAASTHASAPKRPAPAAASNAAAGGPTAPASPAPAANPAPIATPAPAAAPAPATLDLNSLEDRLRDTHAIGVFTKLSLKNQVDDLLGQFRAFYAGHGGPTLAELRRSYELLLMKVVTLLQGADPGLASAVASSREAIWAILSDRNKFNNL